MYASVKNKSPLKKLSSAAAQLRMPTPEAPQQLGVHEAPIHLNRHVELHKHSTGHSHISKIEHVSYRTHCSAANVWLSERACITSRCSHNVSWHHTDTAACPKYWVTHICSRVAVFAEHMHKPVKVACRELFICCCLPFLLCQKSVVRCCEQITKVFQEPELCCIKCFVTRKTCRANAVIYKGSDQLHF